MMHSHERALRPPTADEHRDNMRHLAEFVKRYRAFNDGLSKRLKTVSPPSPTRRP